MISSCPRPLSFLSWPQLWISNELPILPIHHLVACFKICHNCIICIRIPCLLIHSGCWCWIRSIFVIPFGGLALLVPCPAVVPVASWGSITLTADKSASLKVESGESDQVLTQAQAPSHSLFHTVSNFLSHGESQVIVWYYSICCWLCFMGKTW
jgi:hypothetical protein